MGFGDAVASAGPYTNNLQLAQDRYPHQYLITQAACSSWRLTHSVNAPKAKRKQKKPTVMHVCNINLSSHNDVWRVYYLLQLDARQSLMLALARLSP